MNENNFKAKPILQIKGQHVTACTLNYIIENHIYKQEYINLTRTVVKCHLWQELFHEVMMYMLNKDVQQIRGLLLTGEFNFWFYGIVKNQWESNSSTFYNKFRKRDFTHIPFNPDKMEIDSGEEEKRERIKKETKQTWALSRLQEEVEKLDWYERKIWEMYQIMSVPKICKELNKNTKSKNQMTNEDAIYKTLTVIKQKFKKNIKY